MKHGVSRRELLGGTAIAGFATVALPRGSWRRSPNGKLQHAAIGVGGMGWADLNQIASHPEVEVVAICDVDLSRALAAIERFPGVRVYQDWRELFAQEGDRIDSVNVTVPDHMHAPIALTALRRRKHVYCQKPLTHDVHEARVLARAAVEAGVATQMGIQLSAESGDRTTVELLRAGAIGKVENVYLWSNKDTWKYRPTGPRPAEEHPPHPGLAWEQWLGTAPVRPYVPEVYHPTFWRGWQDFGVGWLGDMGCHITHAPFAGLGLTAPRTVQAEVEPEWRDTPERRRETWPTWQIVRTTYPGTALTVGDTIELEWSDGYRYPPEELRAKLETPDRAYPEEGALFLGEEGVLLNPLGGEAALFPAAKFASYPRPALEPRNHWHHWVDACRGKATTAAGFDYAGLLTEAVLLGTVALRRPGEELAWDAVAMRITNVEAANALLRRTYREGWEVEGL
ncbi:MAG: Gfo/Idh/MocA family oxidoreductase [Planctomycetota bacterium]